MKVFHSRPTPIQWVGLCAIAFGLKLASYGGAPKAPQ